ncbi:bifunctional serine/threonine-protein kinase/ABC transporter substrate-binding protein [Nocardia yamanashiensis]|uniref:bifunctional serine/threonine-protein kinase/ABC transporter substrate-binding protein n=1 Tax=Nocardia yamanashiensis TaxID=209247 RepID=UPI00082E112F|nr:bifunctional serine/threonine-protein kinase/ABC transporter substrate-binding protein [Nocardia yamanashiensis]
MVRVGEVFAGFLIERKLGGGGMGEVYLARHPRLPRRIAVKVLARELAADQQTRARFEREAELVARLDHPNIVTVHDRGVEDERLWIAMQYVDGGDASAFGPVTLPVGDAVRIIRETAKALDYAHSMGVIHRDVKPANILLTQAVPGHERRILLTDFGIGRLRDDTQQLTRTGTLAATLAYASPEQLSGDSIDHRSDQYSLACTFFRLLSGATPFHAESAAAVIAGHLSHPAPRVTDRRPELPVSLDEVFARGLAKRPEDRFESCRAFADAAAQALSATADTMVMSLPLGNEPTALTEPEPPAVAGSSRTSKRGRWVAAGVGSLVVAIAAAAGIVWAVDDSSRKGVDLGITPSKSHAAVYSGFVPLSPIDLAGKPVAAPIPVPNPANDGRLPCPPTSIAAALPLSGKDADLGRTVLGGIQLAVSQFVRGGDNACSVTVREFDTAADQTTAAQVAERIAADDSIVAVVGPALSGEVIAAGRTFDDAGLPFLTPVATNPVLAQSGWTNFFRGLANDNAQGPAVARYLVDTAAFSRVCVIRDNGGGFGGNLADAVTEELGSAAACTARIDPTGDLDRTVRTVAAATPDAVYYSGYAATAAKLLTKLRNAGITATFVLGDGGFDPLFRTDAGPAATGTLVACPCGPGTERLLTDYRTTTGRPASPHAVEAYDLTAILLRAIVSGHTDRAAIRTYLHTYQADGIAHSYAWSPTGELTDPRVWLYRVS